MKVADLVSLIGNGQRRDHFYFWIDPSIAPDTRQSVQPFAINKARVLPSI